MLCPIPFAGGLGMSPKKNFACHCERSEAISSLPVSTHENAEIASSSARGGLLAMT